jgi:tetratricopeptide (TPR) repeat protein
VSTGDQADQEMSAYALYQQGQTRLANGKPREAAEALEQALEREPDKASLHETLGRAYFASSRVQDARAEFEAALALEPSNDYAHFGIGRCYERQGRLADAAKHFKLACALAERPDYRDALGRVRARLEAGNV